MNEVGRMWKEAAVVVFEGTVRNLPGKTENVARNLS
jgi:hypothetical protein